MKIKFLGGEGYKFAENSMIAPLFHTEFEKLFILIPQDRVNLSSKNV